MSEFNENNPNENSGATPNENRAYGAENPNPNTTPNPNGDPYRTTGGNSGWQQTQRPGYGANPYGQNPNPYGQTNQNGWSSQRGAYNPNYGAHYQSYQNPGQQKAADEEYKWNFADYDNNPKNDKKNGKKKRKGLMVFTTIICSMFAVAVIGFSGYGIYSLTQKDAASESSAPLVSEASGVVPGIDLNDIPSTNDSIAADGVLTTKQIAAKVRPSVVGIVVYSTVAQNPYANYFGYGNSSGQQIEMAEGSGIIMSSDGYIITNEHVVSGASGIKVVLNNGEEYDAKLIGGDEKTDLAVVKIEADNLTPAEFGDSSQLEIGEDVVAIGNPGGLEFANSVSKGVVSGVDRPIRSSDAGYTMNCIQTDAAINPGNSGGALVNEYGQVVGINSSKIASTEYEGLGFAIPIHEAKPVIDDLIANGRVTGRVKLGVTGAFVDETLARYNNVPSGFMVYTADEGSDIAAKGVVAGDIITKIDGRSLSSTSDISDYLKDFKPGDKVTLTIFRRTSGKSDSTFEVVIALIEDAGEVETTEITPQAKESDSSDGQKFFSFRK